MSNYFHPTSIIHKGCKIEDNVSVGPYSIIGPNVKIGKNTKIHSHVISLEILLLALIMKSILFQLLVQTPNI